MSERTQLTVEQARSILREPGYNAYGTFRLYGVVGDGPSQGQMVAIKSEYYLDQYTYSEVYGVGNDGTGMPPIKRA